MARAWRQIRPLRMRNDDYVEVVDDDAGAAEYGSTIVARIIDTIGTILIAFLSLRFLLSLFGANEANAFASFIYSVTQPLVAPFIGLFGAGPRIGDARLEYEAIIAIVVYGALTL